MEVCSRGAVFSCSQPFATVRNRSQLFAGATAWRKVTVPRGKVAKGIVFVRFQRDVASFCVAGVALRDMWTCFESWRKVAVPMGKVVKSAVFVRFKRDVASFCVAGVALPDMCTCLSRGGKLPYLWEKLQKALFLCVSSVT